LGLLKIKGNTSKKMSNSAETTNQEQNAPRASRRPSPPKKGGGGGGAFLFIILLILAGLGFFAYKKGLIPQLNNTQADKHQPEQDPFKLPPISTLEFPGNNKAAPKNKDQPLNEAEQAPEEDQSFSQNQPFDYANPSVGNNQNPPNNQPQPNNQESPKKQKPQTPQPNPQAANNAPKPSPKPNNTAANPFNQSSTDNSKKVVQSTKFRGNIEPVKQYTTQPLIPANSRPSGALTTQAILPHQGLIPGSLNSFIPQAQAEHPLAIRPDQVITFKTNYFQKSMALDHISNRLIGLGFQRIKIPIDDYLRGGSTTVEALDKFGNQVYFSFKPLYLNAQQLTAWKLEIYTKAE
jgi:outer membrane biosynthesis protein TonB